MTNVDASKTTPSAGEYVLFGRTTWTLAEVLEAKSSALAGLADKLDQAVESLAVSDAEAAARFVRTYADAVASMVPREPVNTHPNIIR
jgi:hypothetical protein